MVRFGLVIAALTLFGCEGSIALPAPVIAHPGPGIEPLQQPVARLHLLTTAQFTNSLHDLLGADVVVSAVEPDVDQDGFASVAASQLAISPAGVEAYEKAIGGATEVAFATDAKIVALFGCSPIPVSDLGCLRKALTTLGRRAYRRPLTEAEVQRFLSVVTDIGTESSDAREGLRYAIWAMLESPSFLYRTELGEPDPTGRLKYTSAEMASRLAATLWATGPDVLLLDAADKDELSTAAGVRAQATRMLADARARAAFAGWVDDLYNTEHLASTIKDTTLYPSWNSSLRDAMHEELILRVDDLVFSRRGDFLSLYDARTTFVNDQLAAHYGLVSPSAPGFREVSLPDATGRRGLLGGGALLSSNALPQRTSPTQRGRFVAEIMLCKSVPPPPPQVITNIETSADAGVTLRSQLELHRQNPACSGCHTLMDPIGLGLERFDSVAVARESDHGHPIDASGVLDGAAFQSAAELATRVREHPNAGPCFVKKLYTAAQGRSVLEADTEALNTLSASFAANGRRADQALIDLVSSDAFRYVEPQAR